ncbi:MAG TPA: type II secretion system protein GspL [Candidatus Binataceae bacterium]|nr:type II secretion system protein GspL [Candidatus Binataceae bacterium]
MGQRILALEIGDETVRAAMADRTYKSLDLLGVYEESRAGEETTLSEAIARIVAKAGPSDVVVSALPGEFVAQRLLTLPFTDRRKLQQTVPYALEEHLPFAVDDAAVAFARVGREDSNSLIVAAFARREELQRHLEMLGRAGLDPKVVTLSSLALAGFLARSRNGRRGSHLVVELDEVSTSLVLLDTGGRPRAMRTISRGLDLREGPDGNSGSANAIIGAIRQTLLAHTTDDETPDLVLAGPASAIPNVQQELSAALEVPVRDLGEFDYSALIHGARPQQKKFTGCFALLLGEAPVAPLELLNFRTGEFTYRGKMGGLGPLRTTVGLGIGLIVAVLLHFSLTLAINARKLHVIDSEIVRLSTPALGNPNPATARADLQAKLTEMTKRLQLLGGNLGHGSPLDVMVELSRAIPANVPIQASSVEIDENGVRIDGSVDSFATVENIKRSLERDGTFSAISVEHAGAGSDSSKVEFRLTAQLKEPKGHP